MKLIDYKFLSEKQQEHDKGIILENGDIIHITVNEKPQTELIIYCSEKQLKICDKEQYFNYLKSIKQG